MGIPEQLEAVQAAVKQAAAARAEALKAPEHSVRLVAVSKTKPVEDLKAAYDAGHRHFGENYVQEIVEKSPQMPGDVQWHFIGTLQSNKVGMLVKGCPGLSCLETISSEKLARAVDKAWQAAYPERPLRVMVQVNSSGEETKNGVDPKDVGELCKVIVKECEGLQLAGLMTIGAPDYSGCRTEDFETLRKCRDEAAAATGLDAESLEMSMGMSSDYENAIREGSTSVRVGSSIFGARHYPAKS
eukprot:TRINITY_DN62194_c0_g1_i1.p1 TRINITY_DN62194_c0_g1~~TRINITY_DN62194_c0_g1_i1.p1  ORF type:complete len:266 (-),score=67.43 TRINITY_DN62194_c0_g1_i1:44-772(-)